MVSTISEFSWVKFVLLLTVVLPAHSSRIPRVFPPCGLSLVALSMCPGLFLVHSLLMGLHHPCDQNYSGKSGRRHTYVFFLTLLLLEVVMVDTC